jgi:hypothetical protein
MLKNRMKRPFGSRLKASEAIFRNFVHFLPILVDFLPNHGRAIEEGRGTGFLHLRYACQLRASALDHSSIWRNLKCFL